MDVAFGSESRIRILRELAARPRITRSEREIAAAIGMSPHAVNRAIASLREAGLVDVERIGNAHAIRLAESEPMREALQNVFRVESELLERVLRAVASVIPRDAACYLFGSTARGEARADSDVDLLVVGKDRESASEIAFAIELKVHECAPARLQIIALGVNDARERLRRGEGVVKTAILHGRPIGGTSFEEVAAA